MADWGTVQKNWVHVDRARAFFVYLSHCLVLTLVTYWLLQAGVYRIAVQLAVRALACFTVPFLLYFVYWKIRRRVKCM